MEGNNKRDNKRKENKVREKKNPVKRTISLNKENRHDIKKKGRNCDR